MTGHHANCCESLVAGPAGIERTGTEASAAKESRCCSLSSHDHKITASNIFGPYFRLGHLGAEPGKAAALPRGLGFECVRDLTGWEIVERKRSQFVGGVAEPVDLPRSSLRDIVHLQEILSDFQRGRVYYTSLIIVEELWHSRLASPFRTRRRVGRAT